MEQHFAQSKVDSAVVVSDLHIGLPYFRHTEFTEFLGSLEPDVDLVLNGDVVDDPKQKLNGSSAALLDLLRSESYRRRVFWTYGNHDDGLELSDPGGIQFCSHLEISDRLLVVHGDDFDEIMPRSLWLIRMMKMLHRMRIRLGARPVHVAEFAKKWLPMLYRILTEEVKKNAVRCALEKGFSAITCGHTHYVEDAFFDGVRYVNTGSWTEEPLSYLKVDEGHLSLIRFGPQASAEGFAREHAGMLPPSSTADRAPAIRTGFAETNRTVQKRGREAFKEGGHDWLPTHKGRQDPKHKGFESRTPFHFPVLSSLSRGILWRKHQRG